MRIPLTNEDKLDGDMQQETGSDEIQGDGMMGTTMNKTAYQNMIREDIEWLGKLMQEHAPHSLEGRHILDVLKWSPCREYDDRWNMEKQTAELTRLKQALGAIHKIARLSYGHYNNPVTLIRGECEQVLTELKQEPK